MTCRNCGAQNLPGTKYCRDCAVPLVGTDPASTQPIYARAIEPTRSGRLLAVIAVFAGLAVGAFVFSRMNTRPLSEATPTVVPPESTPAPPREKTTSRVKLPRESPPRRSAIRETSHESASPPQLLATDANPVSSIPPSSEPVIAPMPQPTVVASSAPPHGVQQTDNSPMPFSPPTADTQSAVNPQAQAPPAQRTARTAYRGPMAGLATWTGKLEKNETLTITEGTPSTGVLSGAGLPGVPVRVTVDQTNLGMPEMPNLANGYRRLVLRSHAKHDKITIHWTVVGQ